ncbi:hypothetical protein D3C81_1196310 [compost metagenome]
MATDQQAPQFVGLEFVGLEAVALKVVEQLLLAQAGVVLLVVRQVQLAGIGEELVTETAARAATDYTDHMWAVRQVDLAEDVAGIAGEVEAP